MQRKYDEIYDAVVIGAGHAGVEACLALARLGLKTLVVTLSLDAISFMACNPAIGGTAKGHLVREVDGTWLRSWLPKLWLLTRKRVLLSRRKRISIVWQKRTERLHISDFNEE